MVFIPTPCLPCQLACGWICTIKGWVVLESLLLAGTYFAAAYVLREIVFSPLKNLFENFLVYQVLKGPLGDWIADVKILFYGCMLYVAIGVAGLLGAILQIQILLWAYAVYLLVTLGLNAKKLWDVLQSILGALDGLKKACGIVSAPFGGDCDAFFRKLDYFMYGGAGFVFLCQALTLICVLVLIRRTYKKTHSLLWTICGHTCGSSRHSSSNDLEQAIPLGRRRRGAARALLAVEPVVRGKSTPLPTPPPPPTLQERLATLPRSSFELERRSPRRERRDLAGAARARVELASLEKAEARASAARGRRQHALSPLEASAGASVRAQDGHAGAGGLSGGGTRAQVDGELGRRGRRRSSHAGGARTAA